MTFCNISLRDGEKAGERCLGCQKIVAALVERLVLHTVADRQKMALPVEKKTEVHAIGNDATLPGDIVQCDSVDIRSRVPCQISLEIRHRPRDTGNPIAYVIDRRAFRSRFCAIDSPGNPFVIIRICRIAGRRRSGASLFASTPRMKLRSCPAVWLTAFAMPTL